MKPRITLVTLPVQDLERAVAFYRDGLGWPTEGIVGREFEHGAVAFFDLDNGLRLALWPRASLAHDSGLPCGSGDALGICLAHNVHTPDEVDTVIAQAQRSGATLVKPAQPTFWGDPEGHLWEVALNPQMLPQQAATSG